VSGVNLLTPNFCFLSPFLHTFGVVIRGFVGLGAGVIIIVVGQVEEGGAFGGGSSDRKWFD
jgi:hypothetical protein